MENSHHCEVSDRVFSQRELLRTHQLTCGKPITKGASFYAAWREMGGREETHREETAEGTAEKVALPDSQEPQEDAPRNTEVNDDRCVYCHRTFASQRGLKQHLRSCKDKKKHDKNTPIVEVVTSELRTEEEAPQAARQPVVGSDVEQQQAETIGEGAIWGQHSEADLTQIVNGVYEEVVTFQKNLFKLPSGAAVKRFLKEKARLIDTWTEEKEPLCKFSLKMVMVMPAVLMQKPCSKSTAKQHTEYLNKRLNAWEEGNFELLMKESRAI